MTVSETIPDNSNLKTGRTGARTLSQRFPVWMCDVWGVVHDGETAFQGACQALSAHRKAGGTVILITNAPRPSTAILPQLADIKVPEDCYDAIVSSGDVTRRLVSLEEGRNVYHLGPEKDLTLIEGMPVNFTGLDEAEVVLCSGLMDDETEVPEDYRPMLKAMHDRDLPMICANPDQVVRKGKRLLPCGGALATIYSELGGSVAMAGKPYAPIYDEALRIAGELRGAAVELGQVMAIGDGLPTDVKGAADYGLALLFIVDGIHERELTMHEDSVPEALRQVVPDVKLTGVTRELSW
jgi:HAD superfamily hydrolase (TIGR01459 family)